ncbi:MAG: hypothetical protein LBD23_00690 [Oscillospiraceae bacterium]|jgi:aspartate carbamoyltransferase regulatory subunit|nr:hypothetical protein [Oscillospiraceae bacterium]
MISSLTIVGLMIDCANPECVGISKQRVESNFKSLKDVNLLKRIGANKDGYWVIKNN